MIRNLVATLQKVSNRGRPTSVFVNEIIDWANSAPDDIFTSRPSPKGKLDPDIFARVKKELGPYTDLQHRKAVTLEVMRVLGGFESSWDWAEGVDTTNRTSMKNIKGQETGLWQVSYDSLPFGKELKDLAIKFCGPDIPVQVFIDKMKSNHAFAMEYIARLLRLTNAHNGPVLRGEINKYLSTAAVAEFQSFLT